MFFHTAGNEHGPYVVAQTAIDVPVDGAYDDYLQLFEHQGAYTLTAPLPAANSQARQGEQRLLLADELNIPPSEPGRAIYEDNRCLPLNFRMGELDRLTFEVFSQEFGGRSAFWLQPRHVEPEYR